MQEVRGWFNHSVSFLVGACFSVAFFIAAGSVSAQMYRVEPLLSGLNRPIYATHAPGDSNGLYVVQQRVGGFGSDRNTGTIFRYDLSSGTSAPFMQLTNLDTDSQGGLHSLAFHPDYVPGVQGSKLYIVALKPSAEGTPGISDSHLEEWALDASGDPQFSRTLLRLPGLQPGDATHAMDWIGFKPGATGAERDWLYVSMGDGGIQATGSGFVNNPQDLDALYGKILRLGVAGGDDRPGDNNRNYEFTPTVYDGDADGSDGVPGVTAPEVFYSGFRNPWRMSFDRQTHDIFIGDVGFGAWEEINYSAGGVIGRDGSGDPASPGEGAANGLDFGWARREGFGQAPGPNGGALDPDGAGIRPDSINPIAAFSHGGAEAHISITGGYVYRGPDQRQAMQGQYFWSDFWFGKSFHGSFDGGGAFQYEEITSQLADSLNGTGQSIHRIASYAEDGDGNLYLIDFGVPGCDSGCSAETGWGGARVQFGTGEVFRISYVPEPGALILVAIALCCLGGVRRCRK